MVRMASYCRLWRLKPSPTKTVTSVFHLLNTSAARELRVHMEGQQLWHWFVELIELFLHDQRFRVHIDNSAIPQFSIPWGYIGQDSELPATPYKDCRKVTKPE